MSLYYLICSCCLQHAGDDFGSDGTPAIGLFVVAPGKSFLKYSQHSYTGAPRADSFCLTEKMLLYLPVGFVTLCVLDEQNRGEGGKCL
jgi:hypothetical protein